ncbi:MAG TPA: TonB-dependent receptor [Candidatus Kapabacteria bacterium]|nr:TonB-dependent receptor [Candidatus Kapabacteria bacterium]
MQRLFALSFILFCCFSIVSSTAQDSTRKTGIITGSVVNAITQAPIAGATIRVTGTKYGAVSKADGKFTIRNVPAGIYSVQANSIGFTPLSKSDIIVSTGKPYIIGFELQETSLQTEEVEVTASYFSRNPETITSTQTLNAEDVRRAPGVQEDIVRAVALLPGVSVTQAGRNDLIVRGGAPFENLFIVDNLEVPNINHFGTQGSTGGPLSIINIDFVREASFAAGGVQTRFGDRVSSLTNISLRNGNEEQFGGELNLSATGFGIIGEGPIADKGSYLFSVRRSYLDLIFKAAGFSFIPEYWDFQTKVHYRLDASNSLTFLAIGALNTVTFNNDDADDRANNERILAPSQNQYFSGLTWKSLFENGYAAVTLGRTFSTFESRQRDSTLTDIFRNTSSEGENSLRSDIFLQLSPSTELTFGNTAKFASQLRYDLLVPDYLRRDNNGIGRGLDTLSDFTAFRNATYITLTSKLVEQLSVTAGVRLDYYDFLSNSTYFSPRVGLSYSTHENGAINITAGRYYQPPQFIWLVGDKSNGNALQPLRADQIIAGYELKLTPSLKIQAETYYKWYANYPARVFRPQAVLSPSGFDDVFNDIPFGLEPIVNSGEGYARGFEVFMQKKLDDIPLYGLLSISINQTRFTALDGIERAGSFDSRYIGNIAVGYRFNEEWELSSKFRLASGLPTTPFIESGDRIGSLDFSRFNEGERLPTFHALDIRLDKRWNFTGLQLVTYIDIQNIYGRKNVSAIRWDRRTNKAEQNESIGLLPSIGVNIEF